jgi:hypothetical protein
MPERVRADVARDAGRLGDPGDHPVAVPSVDRLAGERAEDQPTFGAFPAAGLEDPQDRDGQRHGGQLGALADQVQYPVSAERVAVVLDPDRRGFGGA